MQRDVDLLRASVPLYDCPPRIHLDPDFQVNSVMSYLKRSEKYKDEGVRRAAAEKIVTKCQQTTKRS